MCERTCPNCGSTVHFHGYGIIGTSITCDGCLFILANRRDEAAAPLDMTEAEVEAWQREGTFVLAGAEATDTADDDLFRAVPSALPTAHLRQPSDSAVHDVMDKDMGAI